MSWRPERGSFFGRNFESEIRGNDGELPFDFPFDNYSEPVDRKTLKAREKRNKTLQSYVSHILDHANNIGQNTFPDDIILMTDENQSGNYVHVIQLKSGEYFYTFTPDGVWQSDRLPEKQLYDFWEIYGHRETGVSSLYREEIIISYDSLGRPPTLNHETISYPKKKHFNPYATKLEEKQGALVWQGYFKKMEQNTERLSTEVALMEQLEKQLDQNGEDQEFENLNIAQRHALLRARLVDQLANHVNKKGNNLSEELIIAALPIKEKTFEIVEDTKFIQPPRKWLQLRKSKPIISYEKVKVPTEKETGDSVIFALIGGNQNADEKRVLVLTPKHVGVISNSGNFGILESDVKPVKLTSAEAYYDIDSDSKIGKYNLIIDTWWRNLSIQFARKSGIISTGQNGHLAIQIGLEEALVGLNNLINKRFQVFTRLREIKKSENIHIPSNDDSSPRSLFYYEEDI